MVDMHATSNRQEGRQLHLQKSDLADAERACVRGNEGGEILKSTDGRTDMRMANGCACAAAFATIKWLHHDYTAASSCGGPFDDRLLINDLGVPVPKMFAARKDILKSPTSSKSSITEGAAATADTI